MRLSLSAFLRVSATLALLSVIAAIAVSRLASPPGRVRAEDGTGWVGLSGNHLRQNNHQVTFLDPRTGACRRLDIDPGEGFEYASCSPWRDEMGQTHVVARWSRRTGEQTGEVVQEFGLARFTFPAGDVLDRVDVEPVPAGRPCWFPGTSARVLFAAGDGRLYRFSFEDPGDGFGPGCGDTRAPRALPWLAPLPGAGGPFIRDPVWTTDPRLGHKVLVTLSYLRGEGGRVATTPTEIWWLQLSPDGSAIVDAGRLTRPASPPGGDQEGMPCLSNAPDGGLVLAYLSGHARSEEWDMRVVPLEFGPGQVPVARTSASIRIADHCAYAPPTFAADGRSVFGLRDARSRDFRIERFSVIGALASAPPIPDPSMNPPRSRRPD